jgi:hypothetical protein
MGTAVTLGSSGLIATEYLLRYYALGGRLVREGEPVQLDASLAAAALEEYLHQLSIAVNLLVSGGVMRLNSLSVEISPC